jgi:hypothetical protein
MVSSNPARKQTSRTPQAGCEQPACCSSASAMCYWCVVSLAAWGLLSFVGIFWSPLHSASAATILLAAAVGCFANWLKNRTFHCSITVWLFLAGAAVFLLSSVGFIQSKPRFVWLVVAIGTVFSFVLEWRYAHRL